MAKEFNFKLAKQIMARWAEEEVIPAAQRNIGATQSVKETNSKGTRIRKRRRVASGNLKSALTFFIRKGGEGPRLQFTAKDPARQYAKVIEWGRSPGRKQPPTAEIRKWMDTKRVRLQAEGGGFIKETDAMRDQVAYLISRKIGKYGFEGIHYFRDAVNDKLPLLTADFKNNIEDIFSDID